MFYIMVKEGAIISSPFRLKNNMKLPTGLYIANSQKLTPAELRLRGVYPIIDNIRINSEYEEKTNPVYTLAGEHVDVSYTIRVKDLDQYREEKIEKVYKHAKQLLDTQIRNRSEVETAGWPLVKQGILQYQADGTVSAVLQAIVDRSNYNVADFVTAFAPKIAFEEQVITTRSYHIAQYALLTTHQEIYDYNPYWSEQSLE
jgi:hypothetical protein